MSAPRSESLGYALCWRGVVEKTLQRLRIAWEEAESAILDRQEWCRSIVQNGQHLHSWWVQQNNDTLSSHRSIVRTLQALLLVHQTSFTVCLLLSTYFQIIKFWWYDDYDDDYDDEYRVMRAQTPEVTLTSFTYRKTLVTFDENFYHVES